MKTKTLKILSYNIHKGFSIANIKFIISEIKKTIQLSQADVVFLQEVGGNSKLTSQFEFLADGMWPHFAYGQNSVYQSGHHGNAILSRYPFSFTMNTDLTIYRLEKRGLLHGVINLNKHQKIHLMTLHLDLLENNRSLQLQKVTDYIQKTVGPMDQLILGGDFNDWTERASHVLQNEVQLSEAHYTLHHQHAKSFPSFFPLLPLDRIYSKNLKVLSAGVFKESPWHHLSDHLAITAEFELLS